MRTYLKTTFTFHESWKSMSNDHWSDFEWTNKEYHPMYYWFISIVFCCLLKPESDHKKLGSPLNVYSWVHPIPLQPISLNSSLLSLLSRFKRRQPAICLSVIIGNYHSLNVLGNPSLEAAINLPNTHYLPLFDGRHYLPAHCLWQSLAFDGKLMTNVNNLNKKIIFLT